MAPGAGAGHQPPHRARRGQLCRGPGDPAAARAKRAGRLPLLRLGGRADRGGQPERLDEQHRRHRQQPRQRAGDDASPRAMRRRGAGGHRRLASLPVRPRGRHRPAPMTQVAIDRRKLREVALTSDEYMEIVRRLGREPNDVELGMLGVLWSEHCSYKSSKPLLRHLPTRGPRVLQSPGENAGAVDIGEGWAVVFKVESHNHPSAIEPCQGAATGVGGILRDVIAMGARPIALLDSLRFGPLPDSRHHLEGVVAGIGGYGNCVGVPTVGGEVYFDESYAGNPLVNAMCVGLVRTDQLKRARAQGAGNRLLLVGAQTGRDGIHGASFASLEMDGATEERRPAVQVGNPFLEKCLLEACMEVVARPGVVAIQDLGAAGLTSAIAEVAARSAAGARLDVAAVPRRELGMTPYEVMLSESQERMLVVAEPGRQGELADVFARWDLEASAIGVVTDDGLLVVTDGPEEVA